MKLALVLKAVGHDHNLTITEDRKPMECWHFNDKGKKVINYGVEKLVSHLPPR